MYCIYKSFIFKFCPNNNSWRLEIIIKSFGFTQKLKAEDDTITMILFANMCCKPNWYCWFNIHNRFLNVFQYKWYNISYCGCFKDFFLSKFVGAAITTKSAFLYASSASNVAIKFNFFLKDTFQYTLLG